MANDWIQFRNFNRRRQGLLFDIASCLTLPVQVERFYDVECASENDSGKPGA